VAELAVRTQGLTRSFGERQALAGVDLEVQAGELFALLGPNGGGKSTLFRILSTLLQPSSGEARVFGLDVQREPARVRERIGVVFQAPSLDKKLTVDENLRCQGHLYGLRGSELRQRSDELLGRFGLLDRRRDLVATLSGGLARRVEIAKGMLHRPGLLLLDEPSTGLDPGARRDLERQLASVRDQDGTTVLLTTHILDEAEDCDRVAILDRGRCIALGTPAALSAELGGEAVSIAAKDAASLGPRLAAELGVTPRVVDGALHFEAKDAHALALDAARRFGDEITSVKVGRPTLEDVFLARTGHAFEPEGEARS
jgi:ABC-2 type transport system ATP-binding protein